MLPVFLISRAKKKQKIKVKGWLCFGTFDALNNILNAKRNAHNLRFVFCRIAALQIKFIYTRDYK